jgi:type III polyketide synthase
MASAAVSPAFQDLIKSIPAFHTNGKLPTAADFDWALHPGGSTIITGVEQAMNLTTDHLLASYEIYVKYGNSSSATIMAVMDRLRQLGERRENVVACAFGPGISLEMMLLRRPRKVDDQVDDQVDGLLTEDVD